MKELAKDGSKIAEAITVLEKAVLLDMHERAAAFFQERLRSREGREAREYLKLRGIDDETIVRFRIGYAPESGLLLRNALRREFDEELLRESGLFSWKVSSLAMYCKFRNRVMFPICDDQGTVIAFIGRTLSTDEKAGQEYLSSPETPIYSRLHVIFNLDKAKGAIAKLDYSILVEGQIDCILVYAAGFRNVIASSGIPFTEIQAGQLGRFAKQIIVNLDYTNFAAVRAMEATIGLLVEKGFNIRVIKESSVIIRRGKDAYIEALKHTQSYSNYLIDCVIRETQSASAERALILGLRRVRQELREVLEAA